MQGHIKRLIGTTDGGSNLLRAGLCCLLLASIERFETIDLFQRDDDEQQQKMRRKNAKLGRLY